MHCYTYKEPWGRAADCARKHWPAKNRSVLSKLPCSGLLDYFVNREVNTGPDRVAQGVKMKCRIKSTEPVAPDNLPESIDCVETWLVAKFRVCMRIRRSHGSMGHQDRSLDDILCQFKRAWGWSVLTIKYTHYAQNTHKQSAPIGTLQPYRHL